MKHTYHIAGMTCGGCVASVTDKLSKIDGVTQVDVSLEKDRAEIWTNKQITIDRLSSALTDKYTITKKENYISKVIVGGNDPHVHDIDKESFSSENKSKLQQLKPLLLIFLYLFAAAFLLNRTEWNTTSAMLDFMGLFYIVFSFFKLLDLKGFPESFRMYDPLAKVVPAYGWIYPFIELALGLMLLMRFEVKIALIITIVILGITTIGVTKTLLDKKSIRCACLGTALKLPMTEATFIENTIMLVMAGIMLAQQLN